MWISVVLYGACWCGCSSDSMRMVLEPCSYPSLGFLLSSPRCLVSLRLILPFWNGFHSSAPWVGCIRSVAGIIFRCLRDIFAGASTSSPLVYP